MKKDPFHLISPTSPHYQQTSSAPAPPPPGEYSRERGNIYQYGATPNSMQQSEVIEMDDDGEDSEFQIAMTNLANAKSRYLGSKPPLPPPSSSKPTRGRMHPQPLPPVPQNVTLKKVPVQHRNRPDPVWDAGQIRESQEAVTLRHPMPSSHAMRPVQPIDPIESAFSQRPPSMAFSPLQLAKLPDFSFDDDNEQAVRNKFRISQFYPEHNQPSTTEHELTMQSDSEELHQPHLSSSSSDQQVKVAMLPPTKPSAVCARRQQKNQFNYTTNVNRNSQYGHNNSNNNS